MGEEGRREEPSPRPPSPSPLSFVACARNKIYWMTPEWGATAADLPFETQFLLADLGDGQGLAALLPLVAARAFRGTLRPPPAGRSPADLVLRLESGTPEVAAAAWDGALLVAGGPCPHALADAAVAAAASLSGAGRPRATKAAPAFVDTFGWCTWDALYSQVGGGRGRERGRTRGARRPTGRRARPLAPSFLRSRPPGWTPASPPWARRASPPSF